MQCFTAGGRLLPLAFGGSGWLSLLSLPLLGGGGGWRSSGYVVRTYNQTICVISAIRWPSGLWVVLLPLTP